MCSANEPTRARSSPTLIFMSSWPPGASDSRWHSPDSMPGSVRFVPLTGNAVLSAVQVYVPWINYRWHCYRLKRVIPLRSFIHVCVGSGLWLKPRTSVVSFLQGHIIHLGESPTGWKCPSLEVETRVYLAKCLRSRSCASKSNINDWILCILVDELWQAWALK